MRIEGVQCTDGRELDLTMFEPTLLGFQIVHKITGRLLPSTNHFTIFKEVAAAIRLMDVKETYNMDVDEYIFERVYSEDLESGAYIIIEHEIDKLKEG